MVSPKETGSRDGGGGRESAPLRIPKPGEIWAFDGRTRYLFLDHPERGKRDSVGRIRLPLRRADGGPDQLSYSCSEKGIREDWVPVDVVSLCAECDSFIAPKDDFLCRKCREALDG